MARKHTDRHEQQQVGSGKPVNNMDQDRGDNEFPGYPHYDKKEDIMDGRSDAERVNVDVESLPNFHNATTAHRLHPGLENDRATNSSPTEVDADMDTDLGIEMGTEADVTAEERKMLEDDMYYPTRDEDNLRQARLDDTDFDGEKLNEESFGGGQSETGDDLDIDSGPDATLTDAMGQGDEENQYYSLGGDEKDSLTEGTP